MPEPAHVLVAEDEDLVAVVLAEILESHGFRVTVAHNGLQAYEADRNDPADLLLTDMRMPVMDGGVLIRLIRERRPNLPVIVMTGFSEYLPLEEPGRLIVVRKPFNFDALIRRIEELLSMG